MHSCNYFATTGKFRKFRSSSLNVLMALDYYGYESVLFRMGGIGLKKKTGIAGRGFVSIVDICLGILA